MAEYKKFQRKPFYVEAVQITESNIEELAPLVGDFKRLEDGTPYILVDQRLVPNLHRAFCGYWITKMGDNVRCYSSKIFEDQFELVIN